MNLRRAFPSITALAASLAVLTVNGCGGGGSSTPRPSTQPLTISTNSLPDGTLGSAYNAGLQASGGSGTKTWRITAGNLPAGLTLSGSGSISGTPGEPAATSTFTIQVTDSSSPPKTATKSLTLKTVDNSPVTITTTALPDVRVDTDYHVVLAARGGTTPYLWSVVGVLPPGLTIDALTGTITGTPLASGAFTFTARVQDNTSQQDIQELSINVRSTALDRNDNTNTATPLSNGRFRASLSPFGDPPGTTSPDQDIYKLTASGGAIVTVEIFAKRLVPGKENALDSAIEIMDASEIRSVACRDVINDPGNFDPEVPITTDTTPSAYDDPCMNDDTDFNEREFRENFRDSKLEFRVPGNAGDPPLTFYVRVFDFLGGSRPDMIYDIAITGAN